MCITAHLKLGIFFPKASKTTDQPPQSCRPRGKESRNTFADLDVGFPQDGVGVDDAVVELLLLDAGDAHPQGVKAGKFQK